VLAKHVHLVHIDPADISALGTVKRSPRVWHLSHLGAKLAFLRAGLGFGAMPVDMIEDDLASGALVEITFEDPLPTGHVMSAIYRTDNPPGPAGRWFIERLKQEDAQRVKEKTGLSRPKQSPYRRSVMKQTGGRR
jgi:DNA-binding transcriptional LysR family regulator